MARCSPKRARPATRPPRSSLRPAQRRPARNLELCGRRAHRRRPARGRARSADQLARCARHPAARGRGGDGGRRCGRSTSFGRRCCGRCRTTCARRSRRSRRWCRGCSTRVSTGAPSRSREALTRRRRGDRSPQPARRQPARREPARRSARSRVHGTAAQRRRDRRAALRSLGERGRSTVEVRHRSTASPTWWSIPRCSNGASPTWSSNAVRHSRRRCRSRSPPSEVGDDGAPPRRSTAVRASRSRPRRGGRRRSNDSATPTRPTASVSVSRSPRGSCDAMDGSLLLDDTPGGGLTVTMIVPRCVAASHHRAEERA